MTKLKTEIYHILCDMTSPRTQGDKENLEAWVEEIISVVKKENSLTQVREFCETFGHEVEEKPTIPTNDVMLRRISLIQEELVELACNANEDVLFGFSAILRKALEKVRETEFTMSNIAVERNKLIEILDALCDLRYVLDGTVLAFGFGKVFNDAFTDVHNNNMEKTYTDESELHRDTAIHHDNGIDTDVELTKDGKRYLLKVFKDNKGNLPQGKILKPIKHRKVDLSKYVS